jgi:hypothetical protein
MFLCLGFIIIIFWSFVLSFDSNVYSGGDLMGMWKGEGGVYGVWTSVVRFFDFVNNLRVN